ncbi:hypothetical protein CAP35_01280 [Chitinophagaceae bacterium IBVUCB1]|nr:hypothetical protein CAP35_01280 [Chitinophagaceae bacterium IBVUCB1]
MMKTNTYPAFPYHASELSAFLFSIDTFIVSLKNGQIIHFVADDADAFKQWLYEKGVRDINKDDGVSVIMRSL